MKLLYGTLLLSAHVFPSAAFLKRCSLDTAAQTQLQGRVMIESDYLQSELTAFANEKLVSGFLSPSSSLETSTTLSFQESRGISLVPSFLHGANDFLSRMATDIGNPLTNIQESTMNAVTTTTLVNIQESAINAMESAMSSLSALTAASGQYGIFWSTLASNWMATLDFAPDGLMLATSSSSLVASAFMITSLALSVSDSRKQPMNEIMDSSSGSIIKDHDFVYGWSSFTNHDSEIRDNAENLEHAFTSSKIDCFTEKIFSTSIPAMIEFSMEKSVATSATDAAFGDKVFLVSTLNSTAGEMGTFQSVDVETANTITVTQLSPLPVFARAKKDKVTASTSSLFSQARSTTDSILKKMARLSFQVQQFFRIIVQTFHKATAIAINRGSAFLPKDAMVKTTKFSLVRPEWVVFKKWFSLSRRRQL